MLALKLFQRHITSGGDVVEGKWERQHGHRIIEIAFSANAEELCRKGSVTRTQHLCKLSCVPHKEFSFHALAVSIL